MNKLTHFNQDGDAHMVDVGEKDVTERVAKAVAIITMQPETLKLIQDGEAKKGDVLGVARLAGIMAAKKTADLIPLCHPLALTHVGIEFKIHESSNSIEALATCKLKGRTGVEMEALTAASIPVRTIYDVCRAVDRGVIVSGTTLWGHSGGRAGSYSVL